MRTPSAARLAAPLVVLAGLAAAAGRADGLTDVKVTIGDIKGTFENSMLGTFDFDSSTDSDASADNPMIGPALQQLTLMANRSFSIAFDARGRLAEVHGMREILDEALKSNPVFAGNGLGALIDDDGMKQQMQGQFAMFSDGPVAVGATWRVDSSIKAPVATPEAPPAPK